MHDEDDHGMLLYADVISLATWFYMLEMGNDDIKALLQDLEII